MAIEKTNDVATNAGFHPLPELAPTPRIAAATRFQDLEGPLSQAIPTSMRREVDEIMPLRDQVVVRRVEKQEKTDDGLIWLPDTAKEEPLEGVVLAVGRGRFDTNGVFYPSELMPGDQILFDRYAGTKYMLRGEEVTIMRERDIQAVLRRRTAATS